MINRLTKTHAAFLRMVRMVETVNINGNMFEEEVVNFDGTNFKPNLILNWFYLHNPRQISVLLLLVKSCEVGQSPGSAECGVYIYIIPHLFMNESQNNENK